VGSHKPGCLWENTPNSTACAIQMRGESTKEMSIGHNYEFNHNIAWKQKKCPPLSVHLIETTPLNLS